METLHYPLCARARIRRQARQQLQLPRRLLLNAGVAAGVVATVAALMPATGQQAAATPAPCKPGEFDFLTGNWRIANRRLLPDGKWDVFEGESTCWSILGSGASIEELRIPARNFSGMGLRVLDMEKKVWSDYWMNAKSGVIGAPGVTGYFENGAGIFISEDAENGKPVKYRGLWDGLTANACRWSQASSRDGGATWDDNWQMQWTRV